MSWLSRIGRDPPPDIEEAEETAPARVERGAPGVSALLSGLGKDRSHAVLDLGPAAEGNLRVYSGYARRIRFAGLLTSPPAGESWAEALREIPRYPEQPYDIVLAWNLLDRMAPEHRPLVVERLVDLTAPGARLYAVVDTSGKRTTRALRFNLLDEERVSQEPVGPEHPAWPQILPAEVERVLAPFQVSQAFVLRLGMREYVAARR